MKRTWNKEYVYQRQSLIWWADEDYQTVLLIGDADINSHLHLSYILTALEGQQSIVMRDTTGPSRRWTNKTPAETEKKCLLNGAIVSNITASAKDSMCGSRLSKHIPLRSGCDVFSCQALQQQWTQYHSNSTPPQALKTHENSENEETNVRNIIKTRYLGTAFVLLFPNKIQKYHLLRDASLLALLIRVRGLNNL